MALFCGRRAADPAPNGNNNRAGQRCVCSRGTLLLIVSFSLLVVDQFTVRLWEHAGAKHRARQAAESGGPVSPRLEGWAASRRGIRHPLAGPWDAPDPVQSHVSCVGDDNDVLAWRTRGCVFSNLCLDMASREFTYFAGPVEHVHPLLFDSVEGVVQDTRAFGGIGLVSATSEAQHKSEGLLTPTPATFSWSPRIVRNSVPVSHEVGWVGGVHQLWLPAEFMTIGCNVGHILWDIFAALYTVRLALGVAGNAGFGPEGSPDGVWPTSMIINPLKGAKWKVWNDPMCKSINKVANPWGWEFVTLADVVWKATAPHYGKKRLMCFEKLVAGGAINYITPNVRQPHFLSLANLGRESALWRYRTAVLEGQGLDPLGVPESHHVIIVDKRHSQYLANRRGTKRAIVNVREAEGWLKETYPALSVSVVDFEGMPWREQLVQLLRTTVLITPCGGISTTLPFLPVGAHAIIMDYPDPAGNQSLSMEAQLWNHFPHVRKFYYQTRKEGEDFVVDTPREADYQTKYRHGTSPKLGRERILGLVEAAFRTWMSYSRNAE